VIADPTGQPLAFAAQPSHQPTFAAVGPEGGFTNEELAAAGAAGWDIASLGPRILRIETAAISLAALLSQLR
jgi:16S rRNA (uracil1498-N3)-methyltransferase